DVTERRQLEQRTHEALAALLAMAEELVRGPNPVVEEEREKEGDGEQVEGERSQADEATMPAVALRLAELTRTALGDRRVPRYTLAPQTGDLQTLATVDVPPKQQASQRQIPGGLPLRAPLDMATLKRLEAGETVLVDLMMRASPRPDAMGGHQALLAPLRRGGELLGILSLDHGGSRHAYGPQELALAGAV